MTEIRKREGDDEHYDPTQDRHWHGPPQPQEYVNGSEMLKAGWGDKALTLKGPSIVVVFLLTVMGGILFYLHDIQHREHAQVLKATNMAICVSLYDFDERKQLRRAWVNDPKGAPVQWCPNVGGSD